MFFIAGLFLPLQHFAFASGYLPIYTHLLTIRHTGGGKTRNFERHIFGGKANFEMQSMGRKRL
jgi:hypothetical protein